ncbi:hypothetical protein ACFVTC_21925 [Streptomyces sp. NPDC057950]|uniref:hypothetical protein n=1 Tax=Streptomyces sp. NPDC057950 TaxID=3346288 RepID=UPI0036E42659
MYTRGRRLRFTAVSAMVVLALTGFSSGHGHGSRGHHSGGGGGCSSSRQDHDSSSSTSGGGGSYGSSSSGGSSSESSSSGGDAYGSGTNTGDGGGATYRSRPTHRSTPTASSTGGTARPLKDGTAVLVHCASTADPYATVEVRNPNGRDSVLTVKIAFKDARGLTVIDTSDQVSVSAKDKATVRVPVAGAGHVDEIDHCEVDRRAAVVR